MSFKDMAEALTTEQKIQIIIVGLEKQRFNADVLGLLVPKYYDRITGFQRTKNGKPFFGVFVKDTVPFYVALTRPGSDWEVVIPQDGNPFNTSAMAAFGHNIAEDDFDDPHGRYVENPVQTDDQNSMARFGAPFMEAEIDEESILAELNRLLDRRQVVA